MNWKCKEEAFENFLNKMSFTVYTALLEKRLLLGLGQIIGFGERCGAEAATDGTCGKFMAFLKCYTKEFGFYSQASISQNVSQDTDVWFSLLKG